jgi:hypothetical protein
MSGTQTKTINVQGTSVTATETQSGGVTTLEQVATLAAQPTDFNASKTTLNYDQVNSLLSDTGFTVPTGESLASVTLTYTINNTIETLTVTNPAASTQQLKGLNILTSDTAFGNSSSDVPDPGFAATGTTPDASAINDRLANDSLGLGKRVFSVGNTNLGPNQSITFAPPAKTTTDTSTVTAADPTQYLGNGSYSLNYYTITSSVFTSGGNFNVTSTENSASKLDVIYTFACFLRGTRLATPEGEAAVEALKVGDNVATRLNNHTVFQPIKWIGHRRIDVAAHPRPDTVMPIRIRNGAFADNVPHRDLLVSPDHAIFVDGKLICARQLINGTTIRQEQGCAAVEYFHVELDAHAILLAEGLPTESYLNTGNRSFFANAGEQLVLHLDLTDEADYPTRETASCAPFVWHEDSVRPIWDRLARRAAALGQPVPAHDDATTDLELCCIVQGGTIRPLSVDNGLYTFILPKHASDVSLVSRAGAPTDLQPWMEDRRRLGVYVEQIVLHSGHDVRDVPLDQPSLSQGWWAVEQNGAMPRRWTDGDALLPLPAMDGPVMLKIRATSSGMAYLADAGEQRRAA